ncbi:cytochrome c553 [Tepidimonas ignava]|jgi:cytochrome c553|uniref:Cytochrome c4 n=1 Tax=Tepidimonas ignava TaxID=114249 RepID=A0A4R3LLM3_9BURK|nr:c-type cytochrome [Tepidimonas ignava]TCS98706.1 cytochrome c553 [Tepidimonas ignava]TSE20367.1 Cytochrome c4 [Tepidimonas ignava]
MKPIVTLIGAAMAATLTWSAHAQSAQPDLKRGAALYGQVCVACHAADGNSTTAANPKLAQQHPEYLIKQLQEFKSGKRANAVMVGFATPLSDQDMRDIAYWLASQKATTGAATDAEKVRLGERIYRGGLMDRRIPACAGCHGPSGSGIPAEYPRLSGQHAEYTATQLKLFRTNERANNKQMHEIARYLTDVEIAALADYIAGLR